MPITRSFRETVLVRAQRSALFRRALLTEEAVNELLAGDIQTGKAVLRDYINIGKTAHTLLNCFLTRRREDAKNCKGGGELGRGGRRRLRWAGERRWP